MKTISIKYRMMVLAMLPTFLVSAAISGFAIYGLKEFGEKNNASFRDQMLTLRRNELHNYTQLAESSINNLFTSKGITQQQAKEQARDILRNLRYSSSGYFFVNDYQGNTLVHGANPGLEGRNLWDIKSKDDKFFIRDIDKAAKEGTGFTEYMWSKPGFPDPVEKVSYVKTLEDWGWILGTGLYIDDIEDEHLRLNRVLSNNLQQNVIIFLALSGFSIFLVAIIFGRFTLKEGGSADDKIRALADHVNRAQEHERLAISAELDDAVDSELVKFKSHLPKILTAEGVKENVVKALYGKLNDSILAIQKVSHSLNPKSLKEQGLAYGLDMLSKQFNNRNKITVKLGLQGDQAMRLPDSVEWEVFRVVQDVLRFVEQADNAGKVNLRAKFANNQFQFSILEDAVGFDPKSNERQESGASTLLLNTVVSRIEGIGGEILVFGDKGAGTMIRVNINLNKVPLSA